MSVTGPEVADIERAAARDQAAFRRVYLTTADRTHRLARWLLGTVDVDDVVQEIYVRVWDRLPDLREPAAFGGWLRQVAVSVILRHRERAARREGREGRSESGSHVPDTAAGHVGLRLDLERAVARLPTQARQVFVLYDVEGRPHLEIGELLGISHHTSRSQLHRARALLKAFLKDGASDEASG